MPNHFAKHRLIKLRIISHIQIYVEIQNSKPTTYYNVQVRVHESFTPEMHIDTDDANACAIKTGDYVKIVKN